MDIHVYNLYKLTFVLLAFCFMFCTFDLLENPLLTSRLGQFSLSVNCLKGIPHVSCFLIKILGKKV